MKTPIKNQVDQDIQMNIKQLFYYMESIRNTHTKTHTHIQDEFNNSRENPELA